MPQELAWPPAINQSAPAWRTLQNLFKQSPPSPDQNRLVIFGSAALQLTVTSELLSADIDISLDLVMIDPGRMTAPKAEERLRRTAATVNAALGKDLPYLQVCHWMTFQPANRWERRVFEKTESGWRVVYPHPYDILFSKLRRAETKDIEAFRLVIDRTGHPTETEFVQLCTENYRDFEPRLMAPPSHLPEVVRSHDLRSNTVHLWQAIWGRSIDVDREIREPAVQRLQSDWGDYDPSLKTELAHCAQPPPNKRLPPDKGRDRNGLREDGPRR